MILFAVQAGSGKPTADKIDFPILELANSRYLSYIKDPLVEIMPAVERLKAWTYYYILSWLRLTKMPKKYCLCQCEKSARD